MKDKWYFGNYIVCTMVWFISYWCDSCHVQHKESAWTTLTLNDSFFPHTEHKYAIQSVIEHMKWFIDIILEPWFVFLALPAWEWCVCVCCERLTWSVNMGERQLEMISPFLIKPNAVCANHSFTQQSSNKLVFIVELSINVSL